MCLNVSIMMITLSLMVDKYDTYMQLSSEMEEGKDYAIRQLNRNSTITIMAPHGGKIETGTSQLAEAIAGDSLNLYIFEGRRNSGNRDLHITSHKFDEPQGLAIARVSKTVLGVHGRTDIASVDGKSIIDRKTVYLGGLDNQLIQKLISELNSIGVATRAVGHSFMARHEDNICNRGQSGTGAQLEIPKSMRDQLLGCSSKFRAFVTAVQNALK